jgi:hypothetical protein
MIHVLCTLKQSCLKSQCTCCVCISAAREYGSKFQHSLISCSTSEHVYFFDSEKYILLTFVVRECSHNTF